jgi:type II secretory pathway predicted ATPase ExeA
MMEEYIKYWGLEQHPFILAPDGRMMCVTGQYFECLERLKYAINTSKGGVLIVSEEAGLGKTTTIFRLIDDMRAQYGEAFKFAYIDHPTLTPSQIIAYITGSIKDFQSNEKTPSNLTIDFLDNRMHIVSDLQQGGDKLKNLLILKDALIEVKEQGGKSIIVIDEGQMLCGAEDVLQELRMLINLTHNNEYLHTFILSGQKALWETIKNMPEFWQRLPVRYYFTPLRFEETRELIRYRLNKAGLDVAREIFTDDALEIIHKYSKGLPRTIIALADLALLAGYTDRTRKITFKEVSKAINAMTGRGDSLPYIDTERKDSDMESPVSASAQSPKKTETDKKHVEYVSHDFRDDQDMERQGITYSKPFLITLIVVFSLFFGGFGYHLLTPSKPPETVVILKKVPNVQRPENKPQPQENLPKPEASTDKPASPQEVEPTKKEVTEPKKESRPERYAVVNKDAVNVRNAPHLQSQRIGIIFRGESLNIIDERTDGTGTKWYKVLLYGNREGWISDTVVVVLSK